MTAGMVAIGVLVAATVVAAQPPPARRLSARAVPGEPIRPPLRRSRLTALPALAVGGLATLWVSAGPSATGLIGAAVVVGTVVSRRGAARRRERRLRGSVCELCRAIASELRSGAIPTVAFRAAVEAAPLELHARLGAAAAAAAGDAAELADALITTAGAAPSLDGLRRLAACWRVVVASGAMTAPAVDRVADALLDELELDRALAAALAGPRATWRLLAALPVAGLLLGSAIGVSPFGFLFGSVAGAGCLVGAVLLDAAGLAWTSRIGRRSLMG